METRPVYDDNGNLTDIQVIGTRQGGTHTPANDFIEQYDGSYKHAFQDVSLESDQDDVSTMRFNMEDYMADMATANPDLLAATQWCANAPEVPPGFIEEWNQLINEGNDLARINQLSEQLLEMYKERLDEVPQSEEYSDDTEVDEWYESLDDDLIENTVDEIMESDFTEDHVRAMGTLTDNYQEGTVERDILLSGLLIAHGELDATTAMDTIFNKYGEAEAARAYFMLQEQLQNY